MGPLGLRQRAEGADVSNRANAGARRGASVVSRQDGVASVSNAPPISGNSSTLTTSSQVLVLDGGRQASATLADIGAVIGGGSGGPAWRWQEVNLGSVPAMSGKFVVSYSGATVGQLAHVVDYPVTLSNGELGDRCEADSVTLAGQVLSSDQITVYWRSSGPLAGLRAFAFTTVNLA